MTTKWLVHTIQVTQHLHISHYVHTKIKNGKLGMSTRYYVSKSNKEHFLVRAVS